MLQKLYHTLRPALLILFLLPGLALPTAALAQAGTSLADAQVAMLEKIQAAEQSLAAIERRISDERAELAGALNQAEQRIRRLQEETAAARRLNDEATLSIQQLEQRLDTWEEQSLFQQNLLGRFYQQASGENWPASTPLADKVTWLTDMIGRQQALLYPTWQSQEVVMPNGALETVEQLAIGPVTWFWQPQRQQGGFLDQEAGRAEVTLRFSENRYNNSLGELHDTHAGTVIFDPTLSRALRLEQEQESLVDHIAKGGLWVFPILFFGVFALSIGILKTLQLWRLPPVVPDLAERLPRDRQAVLLHSVQGMQKQLVKIVQHTPPGQVRDDRLIADLMESKHRLEYWLGAIAITAAVSPLLGLLGTVSGMIEAFRLMTLFGAGDPAAVSSGISEALVTTELGLIVAIPSLVMHALLSRRAKSYYGQLEKSAITLSQLGAVHADTHTDPGASPDASPAGAPT